MAQIEHVLNRINIPHRFLWPWPLRVGKHQFYPGEKLRFCCYWNCHSFILSGCVRVRMTDGVWELRSEDLYFAQEKQVVTIEVIGTVPAQIASIDWLGQPLPSAACQHGTLGRPEEARDCHEQLFRWLKEGAEISPCEIAAKGCQWLAAVYSCQEVPKGASARAGALVKQACHLISTHLGAGFNLSDIARFAGASVATLRRAFQRETGKSPKAIWEEMQMRRACDLLLHTDFTLNTIAKECGFAQGKNFSRRFSKIYGLPPGQWRKRFRC